VRGPTKFEFGGSPREKRIVRARLKRVETLWRAICGRVHPCPVELGLVHQLDQASDGEWLTSGLVLGDVDGLDAVGLERTGQVRYSGLIGEDKVFHIRIPADDWGPEVIVPRIFALTPRTAFRVTANGDYAFVKERRDATNRLIGRNPLPPDLRSSVQDDPLVGSDAVSEVGRGLLGQTPILPAVVVCLCRTRNLVEAPRIEGMISDKTG